MAFLFRIAVRLTHHLIPKDSPGFYVGSTVSFHAFNYAPYWIFDHLIKIQFCLKQTALA